MVWSSRRFLRCTHGMNLDTNPVDLGLKPFAMFIRTIHPITRFALTPQTSRALQTEAIYGKHVERVSKKPPYKPALRARGIQALAHTPTPSHSHNQLPRVHSRVFQTIRALPTSFCTRKTGIKIQRWSQHGPGSSRDREKKGGQS
jgi:hypothetical protein